VQRGRKSGFARDDKGEGGCFHKHFLLVEITADPSGSPDFL
jgi:hypothetical protein